MKISALLSMASLATAFSGSRHHHNGTNSDSSFGVVAARSGSPIHFLPMTASDSKFWLGGASRTYCPTLVPNCAQRTNETVLFGDRSLDVIVPGGQAIYVDRTGALSFTRPHSGYIPPGSSVQGFKVHYSGHTPGTWTFKGHGASGFMACPAPANVTASAARRVRRQSTVINAPRWQIFAAMPNATVPTGNVSDCLGFEALAVKSKMTTDQLAWEYI
ncbi:hypothetical protein N7539_004849 [Penicillium diatomitis]|uniref:IgE-binding protein n=1 Tax=Penicillium diatomitis TaxID=2819901 RepID=A0A9X0BUI0_9EURO|nr:uncharacterized protein N7539_004849 [Penicillium diatomitis]KAJ5484861.1 hypothetical protein N7539_004849 [Penicillium diatomitis]